jgi:hypothetical protein
LAGILNFFDVLMDYIKNKFKKIKINNFKIFISKKLINVTNTSVPCKIQISSTAMGWGPGWLVMQWRFSCVALCHVKTRGSALPLYRRQRKK